MRTIGLAFVACLVVSTVAAQTPEVPDAPDLTIRIRRTESGPQHSQWTTTEVISLKGARQRHEIISDGPGRTSPHAWINISQCDQHRTLRLNDELKIYAYEPIEDPATYEKRIRAIIARQPAPAPETQTGPIVNVTYETVDTGERRIVGPYTARHFVNTRTTEPGPAGEKQTKDVWDGWYLDLPPEHCWRPAPQTELSIGAANVRTRFTHRGPFVTGRAIEGTARRQVGPTTVVSKTELVEVSEAPIDDALFTVPDGYRPAVPNAYGGYDLNKPDTFINRLTLYRDVIVMWANNWIHPGRSY